MSTLLAALGLVLPGLAAVCLLGGLWLMFVLGADVLGGDYTADLEDDR